jgi:hypothetical protein
LPSQCRVLSPEHLVPDATPVSSRRMQASARHYRPLLNHPVEHHGSAQSAIFSSLPRSAICTKPPSARAAARPNPHRPPTPHRFPRVPSSEAFGRRPYCRVNCSRRVGIRNPCVDGPRFARTCCSWRRVWSIAVMCPALMCGRVDRGPRWVTRIGPQTSRRGARPKGFPGVFRSSVRPIAIFAAILASARSEQGERA